MRLAEPVVRSRVKRYALAPRLLAGVALIGIAWPIAWTGPAPYSEHTFFPLWLGYILIMDGLTLARSGSSLLERSPRRFLFLFVGSLPLWWLFEFANESLNNWHYVMARNWNPAAYALLASIAFSTVLPAMFVTAEFYRTLPGFRRPIHWIHIAPSDWGLAAIATIGLAMFVASLVAPSVFFPFVWIGVFLLVDPINRLSGGQSIAAQVEHRRWDTVLVLFAAGITCGFFWELWNVRSLPKWTYEIPGFAGPRLFEMPVLGYGGYLPFALEIYAIYNLLHTIVWRRPDDWLRFDRLPEPLD